MKVSKLHIARVLNVYISTGVTDTRELGQLIGKSQRTIQSYLDLTDDQRNMSAQDAATIARHFCSLGRYELSYLFVGPKQHIQTLLPGKATGDVAAIISRIAVLNGEIAQNFTCREGLRDCIEQLEAVTADLKAERALLIARETNVCEELSSYES